MKSNYQFSTVPTIHRSRSRFDLSHGVKTSGNVGTLYPFEVQEVYAGDTMKIDTAIVSRLTSQFLRPVMDNLFLDVYYFFVPSRICYDKYVNIFGENTESAWANEQEYEVPYLPKGTIFPEKSVADYMNIPTKVAVNEKVNVLPFRAFAKIYNDWFRDENNVSPMHVQNGELSESESPNTNAWSPNNYFGLLPKVAKMHDVFTSALPAPQKGDSVSISVVGSGIAPVDSYNRAHPHPTPLYGVQGDLGTVPVLPGSIHNMSLVGGSSGQPNYVNSTGASGGDSGAGLHFTNLWADLSQANFSATDVNDLRMAFQYQRLLERAARSGTRYTEYLSSAFGVSSPDSRLQRPEFLGGRRTPISIHQVVQTTGSGSSSSPLAEVGAFSQSNARSRFTKSFTENGYVIGVYCIRQFHTYQQGLEKFWRRTKRLDFYDPVFASLGEQPIHKTELYASSSDINGQPAVFGFQEAWYDLRSRPNGVTGQMRSNASDSLDFWHFADNYSNAPTLNEQFVSETPVYVDRAITVPSSSQDQFILDFYIKNMAVRVAPTRSVPGLIDHH